MRDLTIQDSTQISIMRHLMLTEQLLARAASKASGREQSAEIWAMPDLGLPNNINRIHGGFFTGALYTWQTSLPIVPVDATVNCCGVSVFRVNREINRKKEFNRLIERAKERTFKNSSYIWNFSVGNHFVIYGEVRGSSHLVDGRYVVLHSSASEFKKLDNGLYPTESNWYAHEIKTLHDEQSHRYIRYIEGRTAEKFIRTAQMLEGFNRLRHEFFAGLIFGESYIEEEIINIQHYGMPTANAVAIGCQWFQHPSLYLLLTAPGRPLFFVQTHWPVTNEVCLEDTNLSLHPHGLGKESLVPLSIKYVTNSLFVNGKEYSLNENLENTPSLRLRNFLPDEGATGSTPRIVRSILDRCTGDIVASLEPMYIYYNQHSNR